jgi:hypothetical protein
MAPEFLESPRTAAQERREPLSPFAQPIVLLPPVVVLGRPAHRLACRPPLQALAHARGKSAPPRDGDRDCRGMRALPAKALSDNRFLRPDSG